jgi:hypothetical protein
LIVRAEAGKDLPAFSIYSEEHDGLAETGRILRGMGWEPIAVARPIQSTRDHGLLFLVEPQVTPPYPGAETDLTEAEVKALLNWVEQGNTLAFFSRHGSELHHQLGIDVFQDSREGADALATAELSIAPELGGGRSNLPAINRLVVAGDVYLSGRRGVPLWWLGREQNPGALLLRQGKGWVLVVADPSLLTLHGLQREDNVLFLYNVAALHAQDGRVYFDEFHHGLRSGGGFWGYLRHYGLLWTLLPILLVMAMAGWHIAVRLGPAIPLPRRDQADTVDYASAVARIYHRAGARRLLARALSRSLLTPLTRHLRLRRAALPAEVLAAWRQRYPEEPTARLQGLLRGLAELRKEDLSDRQLLHWAQAFDRFEKELSAH